MARISDVIAEFINNMLEEKSNNSEKWFSW